MAEEVHTGPTVAETITEVRGSFPSDAALEDAIGRLTLAGFDRADLSLPQTGLPERFKTPEANAAAPTTEDDQQQARTLHVSGAGSVAALAAAGVTVATGGAAAVAAAAAALAGVAAGGIVAAATHSDDNAQHAARETQARAGELLLSVRVTGSDARRVAAEAAMKAAGAADVRTISRANALPG